MRDRLLRPAQFFKWLTLVTGVLAYCIASYQFYKEWSYWTFHGLSPGYSFSHGRYQSLASAYVDSFNSIFPAACTLGIWILNIVIIILVLRYKDGMNTALLGILSYVILGLLLLFGILIIGVVVPSDFAGQLQYWFYPWWFKYGLAFGVLTTLIGVGESIVVSRTRKSPGYWLELLIILCLAIGPLTLLCAWGRATVWNVVDVIQ